MFRKSSRSTQNTVLLLDQVLVMEWKALMQGNLLLADAPELWQPDMSDPAVFESIQRGEDQKYNRIRPRPDIVVPHFLNGSSIAAYVALMSCVSGKRPPIGRAAWSIAREHGHDNGSHVCPREVG
eukprot:3786393-Amphidinium_carterae.1